MIARMQIAPHLARNHVATFTVHEPVNLTGKSELQELTQKQIFRESHIISLWMYKLAGLW
jgi:hypothetical protein